MKSISINELVAARIEAKRNEDSAIQARRKIDEQISTLMNKGKAEGTESVKLEDMGLKVSVTYKVTRSVDADALTAAWSTLAPDVQSAFKWNPDVSVSALRKLEDGAIAAASKFIESKPAAPSVKIEIA